MTMNDPIDNRAIPDIPLPLVHPSASRAPSKKINPPQKAIAALGKKAVVRRILDQMGDIVSGVRPDSFLER
jgi:hypothetical protein